MSQEKMICPKCGAEMNHHALKVDYGDVDPELIDNVFEGVLKEVHTCPKCGNTEMPVAK
jgi:ribosomal protein S27AE